MHFFAEGCSAAGCLSTKPGPQGEIAFTHVSSPFLSAGKRVSSPQVKSLNCQKGETLSFCSKASMLVS